MRRYLVGVTAAASVVLLSGCGTTVYGPRRLIAVGQIDSGPGVVARNCPATPPARPAMTRIDLPENFYDKACVSLRAENDSIKAREMMDAGITLTRMRCNDFFAERAGHQTQERVFRRSVAPVSAVLTGIIGLIAFKTDAGRQQAIQILGIGQSATIAGLELYESEFLFGSANVNSVRTLTMRALDEHARLILDTRVAFYGAARHLIDHQMICTPANILELSQSAIREGRIAPATPIQSGPAVRGSVDRSIMATLSSNLRITSLTSDQLGCLWWLTEIVRAGGTPDQNALAIIKDRLKDLPLNPVSGATGSLTIDTALVGLFANNLGQLSTAVTNGFFVTKKLLERRIAALTPSDPLERAKDISFELPPESAPPAAAAVEVGIPAVSTKSD